jgi:putative endonuclease
VRTVTTTRQRRGAQAEEIAAAHVEKLGWQVVARNVKVGRDEVDLLAIDPAPPRSLVFVEVRSVTSSVFGAPEERVDRAKVGHLYRAMAMLSSVEALDPAALFLRRRVDLLVVDRRGPEPQIRHLRALEPA